MEFDLSIQSILFRLALAMLFGGIVGFERGLKGRAAGLRTHMLVCIGATLVMITNQYLLTIFPYPSDPARLGAQVISGIGFLGAGTIIVTKQNQVKGLTTAAGLWASACLGLAIGVGFYRGAIVAGISISLIIAGLHKFDRIVVSRSRNMDVYVEFEEGGKISTLMNFSKANSILVVSVEFAKSKLRHHDSNAALISLRLPKGCPHRFVVDEFIKLEGIYYIEEV